MDVFDPFMTVFRENPDFSPRDERTEAQQLLERHEAIERSLRGEEHPDYLLDLLEAQGVDPCQYVHAVVENVNYVIDNGIRFTSNDSGLFLPEFFHQ